MSGIESAFFGSLADDAQSKVSKAGKTYLRFRVRVGEGEYAQWVGVMCFDPSVIAIADKMMKGARVYCEGRIELDEWTGSDGTKRSGLSCMSFHTRLAQIGRQKVKREDSVSVAGGSAYSANKRPRSQVQAGSSRLDDSLPF